MLNFFKKNIIFILGALIFLFGIFWVTNYYYNISHKGLLFFNQKEQPFQVQEWMPLTYVEKITKLQPGSLFESLNLDEKKYKGYTLSEIADDTRSDKKEFLETVQKKLDMLRLKK